MTCLQVELKIFLQREAQAKSNVHTIQDSFPKKIIPDWPIGRPFTHKNISKNKNHFTVENTELIT